MRKFGYTRVSTENQLTNYSIEVQREKLIAWGVPEENIFAEAHTATEMDRPVLNELSKKIREGDLLITVTVDRLTRDLFDGAEFINRIYKKGGIITSLDLPADYNSPFHKFMLIQFMILAEHDYVSRRLRQKAGIEKARAAKKYKGRAPKYEGQEREEIYKKFEAGHISPEDLMQIYKISRSTLFRIVREYRTATEKLKELTTINSSH
jgi:DNA invertase Pin-like site-specific DNA recombinase